MAMVRLRSRRFGAGVAVLLTCLLALPARAEPFRLIITDLTTPLVPNSVLDLADRLGYFKREGVDVQLVRVQQTPSALAALKAGEGDMANVGTDAALQMIARGLLRAKVVDSPARSFGYMIIGKADIADVKALKGRSFGVGRIGSADQSLTAQVLAGQGLSPGDVDYVAMGQPASRLQALAAGQIDATTVSIGTWAAQPAKARLHVLLAPEDFQAAAPVITKVDIVPDAVLASRRAEVEGVVRALVKISRDFSQDPQRWVEAVAAVRTDVGRPELERLATAYKADWSVNGGIDPHDLRVTAEWLTKSADFRDLPALPLSSWTELSVLRSVLGTLGPAPGTSLPVLE